MLPHSDCARLLKGIGTPQDNPVGTTETMQYLLEELPIWQTLSAFSKASSAAETFEDARVSIEDNIFKKASELKAKYKERKLSYVDCIGYSIAQSLGIKFLTGDKQFADLDNVKFV